MAEHKRRFLDQSMADGRGGSHSTGVRGWLQYTLYGRGVSAIPVHRDFPQFSLTEFHLYCEDLIEDFAVWYVIARPNGRFVSARSVGK